MMEKAPQNIPQKARVGEIIEFQHYPSAELVPQTNRNRAEIEPQYDIVDVEYTKAEIIEPEPSQDVISEVLGVIIWGGVQVVKYSVLLVVGCLSVGVSILAAIKSRADQRTVRRNSFTSIERRTRKARNVTINNNVVINNQINN